MSEVGKKILIVDDDEDLAMLIVDMLEDNGYSVIYASSIEEAYDVLEKQSVDLILLDINLPDGTGFELCKELRETSTVPVIFASARTSEDDKIVGLDMGGDDYIAKPYSLKELRSRINSLLRRTYGFTGSSDTIKLVYKNNEIEIEPGSRLVKRNNSEVSLSIKEYDLLYYMAQNKNKAMSKENLVSKVWGAFSLVEQQTLTVHIRWLREKLEDDPSKPELLKTVWGVGYKLEAE